MVKQVTPRKDGAGVRLPKGRSRKDGFTWLRDAAHRRVPLSPAAGYSVWDQSRVCAH